MSDVTQMLRIVALGGLGEIGMNCLVLEAQGRLMVLDCGITFPDHEPGIDIIHPDFGYLLDRAAQVEGIVLTHGHEDHIGALSFLLRDLERAIPVYGPAYALALVKERLREADLPLPPVLHETRIRQEFELGPFAITPFRVTHSIPDATGLVIRAEGSTIVHSGDFKIEDDPLDGEHFDAELLAEIGNAGVRLLLSDSTNSEVEGSSGGERPVRSALEAHIARARARVVVCMFASNVHRLGAVLECARRCSRRVLLLGRSLQTHARLARQHAMLPDVDDLLVPDHAAASIPREQLLVVATGSQGEPAAALRRLAHGVHRSLALEPGDEVLLASRVIPGRERLVHDTINALERRGVRVITRRDDPELHVSGHACRDEQRKMIELTRPRAFIPVHGTLVHLQRHAALAHSLGVTETLVVENGSVIEIDPLAMRIGAEVETGRVHIQRGNEISEDVLRDRMRMAEGGLVVVVVPLAADGSLDQKPSIIARGVADDVDLSDLGLLEEAEIAVARVLRTLDPRSDAETVESAAARAARRVFRDALGWRPAIHAIVRQGRA